MTDHILLDANAHVPVNEKAMSAYVEFNKTLAAHGHPSSPSEPGKAACEALENSRAKIAELIGAKQAGQIIFTSTCTQACEWAAEILQKNQPDKNNVLVSVMEHPAMRDAARKSFPRAQQLKPNHDGGIDFNHLASYDKTICIHTQNEVGVIYDVKKLKTHSGLLLADMSQSLGKIPVNVTDLDVDIAVFGAHKFGGLGSLGFIYLKDSYMWRPFGTGSRYFMDRTGTMDVASIVSSEIALQDAIATLPIRTKNMIEFITVLEKGLSALGFQIIGERQNRVPNTTFAKVPNKQALSLMKHLADNHVYVGLGSACGSMHTGDNPLMKHLNINGGTSDFIRISQWGHYNKFQAEKVVSLIYNFINSVK